MTNSFKVYGQHDENTLSQMQQCMNVGSAEEGVLCADGHFGYNHPIGGVVGYSDHISISGVGFDIACGMSVFASDYSANFYLRKYLKASGYIIDIKTNTIIEERDV